MRIIVHGDLLDAFLLLGLAILELLVWERIRMRNFRRFSLITQGGLYLLLKTLSDFTLSFDLCIYFILELIIV